MKLLDLLIQVCTSFLHHFYHFGLSGLRSLHAEGQDPAVLGFRLDTFVDKGRSGGQIG